MADVLIVCVREDEAQAKSLADMFEQAGFSVGGAPSSDAALRSCGATVVMWSQASIRSRPFLDASQRAVNAGKAILACMIDPPPGESVNNAPAFDIGDWDGDSEDPCLDPLFFAVDRMVAGTRANAGGGYDDPPPAPARHERSAPRDKKPAPAPTYARAPYEAPRQPEPRARTAAPAPAPAPSYQTRAPSRPTTPPPRMDASRIDAPPPRTPAPRHDDYEQRHDPLGSEADLWRSIRHSRNPADFLDYLAKYGHDGAFSELAELRLKDLQGRSASPAREQAPREPAPAPAPQRRAEHSFDPAPRLREREPERPMPKSFERRSERPPAQVRESGGGGGIARTFLAVVLLGGAALAGGLYFGLNQQGPAEIAENHTADTASTPPPAAEASAPSTDDSVSYEEAALDPPQQVETARSAPRGGPDLPNTPTPRQSSTPRPSAAEAEQQTRDLNAAALSGPVPLNPTQQTPAPTPAIFVEPAPVVTYTPPAASTPQAPRAPGRLSWAAQPSAARIAALYPTRASRLGQTGSARLDCTVRPDLGLSCTIASESPQGAGFGQAALRAANYFRVNPSLSNGDGAAGAHTNVTIRFQGS